MREHPILFSSPMVRAILEGRKTQTRRIVKPQTAVLTDAMARALDVRPPSHENMPVIPCPYGNPGDRLLCYLCAHEHYATSQAEAHRLGGEAWAMQSEAGGSCARCGTSVDTRYRVGGTRLWVRETFHTSLIGDAGTAITYKSGPETTNEEPWHNFTSSVEAYEWTAQKYKKHWMPSIHMPRWASRITLEVESVRVERLQDINEEDAKAEGVTVDDCFRTHPGSYGAAFKRLWESINGEYSFDNNPWVWCISFRKL